MAATDLSWHEVGRAIDIGNTGAAFDTIKSAFLDAGFVWGGTFKKTDNIHFELRSGGVLSQTSVDACSREHYDGR